MSTVISADWVLPVEGAPIERGAVAIEDGRIAAVGTIGRARRGRAPCGRGDRAGLRERALAPRVRGLRGLRRRARVRALARAAHRAQATARAWTTWTRSPASARRSASRRGSPRSATRATRGSAAIACAELGLRGIVYIEVFRSDPAAALARFDEVSARIEPPSPTGCGAASRRTRRTPRRRRCTRVRSSSGCR